MQLGEPCLCDLTNRAPGSFYNCTKEQAVDESIACTYVLTCPLPRKVQSCKPACEQSGGVCHRYDARCDCPPGMRVVDAQSGRCEKQVEACELTEHFELPCTHSVVTCACQDSCEAFLNASLIHEGLEESTRPVA